MCEVMEKYMKESKAEGEAKMATLVSTLSFLGRTEDIAKAAIDKEAREAFYREFKIE